MEGGGEIPHFFMETVEALNQRLKDYYGIDTVTTDPIFRIVWADDQVEKRLVEYLDTGIALLFPEVREVKKYPYLKGLYVLERLVVVPEINAKDLPASKVSYEPLWAYRDARDNPLPPIWDATKFVIDALYAVLGKKSLVKYVDTEGTEEARQMRVEKLQEELFGNETNTGDALAHNQAVIVPRNYEKAN